MREVKVRGYAVEQMVKSQWLYGFGVSKCELTNGTSEVILYTDSSPIEVHEKSVGQYTGLKDKNGREIYEGDILKSVNDNVEVVQFHHGGYEPIMCYAEDVFEVIGNIYENPELLEGDSN